MHDHSSVWKSFASLVLVAGLFGRALAISPAGTLLLFNIESSDSIQIAAHYAHVHPGVRGLALKGVSTDEEISADEYLATIRPQVLAALDDSIDVIVTTKGLPLRITTAPHSNPETYTDPSGTRRTVYNSTWKPYSSFESELARIDTFSTWEQLGDQTYWLPEGSVGAPHPSANPYYGVGDRFDHATYGTRLTARLDGFSTADVKASIDRAQHVFVGDDDTTRGMSYFVLDDDPNAQGGFPVDRMESLRDNVLAPRNLAYSYDDTDAFVRTAPGPVLGYVGHGVHGGAPRGYLVNSQEGLDFSLANGAVFHTYESYNARSFAPGFNQSQGLIAEWIAAGGTAGVGHVQEPLSGIGNVTNEDIMFQRLLDGYTWAEAAWSATAQLSYVNTVVGDPLMVYRRLVPGDANLDGLVGAADMAIVSSHLGAGGEPGSLWKWGDFTGDGRVSAADIALLNANSGAVAEPLGAAAVATALLPAAEPSATALALLGTLLLVLHRQRPGTTR